MTLNFKWFMKTILTWVIDISPLSLSFSLHIGILLGVVPYARARTHTYVCVCIDCDKTELFSSLFTKEKPLLFSSLYKPLNPSLFLRNYHWQALICPLFMLPLGFYLQINTLFICGTLYLLLMGDGVVLSLTFGAIILVSFHGILLV